MVGLATAVEYGDRDSQSLCDGPDLVCAQVLGIQWPFAAACLGSVRRRSAGHDNSGNQDTVELSVHQPGSSRLVSVGSITDASVEWTSQNGSFRTSTVRVLTWD